MAHYGHPITAQASACGCGAGDDAWVTSAMGYSGYLWRMDVAPELPTDLLELLTGLAGGFLLPTTAAGRPAAVHAGSVGSARLRLLAARWGTGWG